MLCFWGYGQFALPLAETALYGLVFGIFFFLASAMSAKGNMIGSMALTSVIMNMSLIVPLLYSILSDLRRSGKLRLHSISYAHSATMA